MANIKELLGESYKEGMTLEEVDAALEDKKLVDLSTGEYVAKGKYDTLETKYQNLKAEHEQVKEQTKDYETLKAENENFKTEKATADLKAKLVANGINEKYFNYVKMDIDSKALTLGDDEKANKTAVETYLKEHPEFAAKPEVPVAHKEVIVSTGSGKATDPAIQKQEINKSINDGFREALGINEN